MGALAREEQERLEAERAAEARRHFLALKLKDIQRRRRAMEINGYALAAIEAWERRQIAVAEQQAARQDQINRDRIRRIMNGGRP